MLQFQSPPLSWIVTPLDGVEDIRSGLRSRPVVLPIHPLALEHPKAALRCRIVGAAAYGTHAAGHGVGLQKPLVRLRGELTAPIRVQNNRGAGWSLP